MIDLRELGILMRSLGQPTTRDKLSSMIAEIDRDGSETVDFDEFLTLFKQREQHVFTEGDAKTIFDEFDLDQDGAITADDWKHWLNRPNRNSTLSKLEMDNMIREWHSIERVWDLMLASARSYTRVGLFRLDSVLTRPIALHEYSAPGVVCDPSMRGILGFRGFGFRVFESRLWSLSHTVVSEARLWPL